MDSNFKELLSLLNEELAEYLIIGSYALIVHAQPRYTKDIDLWIGTDASNVVKVYRALARFGAPLKGILEVEDLQTPGTIYHMGQAPGRIDVLTTIEGVAFDEAWPNRLPWMVDDEVPAHYISLDDFIRAKAASGRPQDIADIAAVQQAAKKKRGGNR